MAEVWEEAKARSVELIAHPLPRHASCFAPSMSLRSTPFSTSPAKSSPQTAWSESLR
jgi:hypothetical protein